MAGFYPDVPANRFAYHLDGTTVLLRDGSNNLYDMTASAANINDEDFATGYNVDSRNGIIFIFPELRNVLGYFFSQSTNSSWLSSLTLESSTDTTNGLDGTWVMVANPFQMVTNTLVPQYRQNINTVSATSVKAVRFNFVEGSGTNEIRGLHLYGNIPVTQNPNRLIFWEPVNNNEAPGPYFDWGDMPLSTAATKQFRVKNNSSTLTANSITLSAGPVTYSMALQYSTDNVSFASSVNIGNLAPGATSSVLYVKRTVPGGESLRVQAIGLRAAAASWT